MANGFPIIGQPIPPYVPPQATALAPPPGMEPFVPPTEVPMQPQADDFWARLQNDPAAISALLQFAGGVIQPKGIMDTSAGVFGRALSGAAQSFTKQKAVEKEQEERAKRTGLMEREVEVKEEMTPSEIALTKAEARLKDRLPQARAGDRKVQQEERTIQAFANYYGIQDPAEARIQWEIFKATDGLNIADVAERNIWMKQAEFIPTLLGEEPGTFFEGARGGGLVPAKERAPQSPGTQQFSPIPQGLTKQAFSAAMNDVGMDALYAEYGKEAVDAKAKELGVVLRGK